MPVNLISSPNPKSHRSRKISLSLPSQRNVRQAILSDLRVEAWYPSFYPVELIGKEVDRLFVCKWCFKYTVKLVPFLEHTTKCCTLKDEGPLGALIYEKGPISIYEVDGSHHKLFTTNLSLFAKLFLDTKSVFYDVTTFIYYTLFYRPSPDEPGQVVGFFSKEKLSWDNNNLACICVFPPWQKKGFGQVLMAASYELSRYDERMGGPEKPLSEMGRKAYIGYWSATVARFVAGLDGKTKEVTVEDISRETCILPEDLICAMQEMDVLEPRNHGAKAVINKAKVLRWMAEHGVDMTGPVDREAFVERVLPSQNGDAMEMESE